MTAPGGGRLAVVDVGSNSLRLLLCEGIDGSGPRGERFSTVIGLRRGAGPDGSLADDALQRLDACLAAYARRISAFHADRVVAVGTSAVRDAPDRHRVIGAIAERLGTTLTVLDGGQEAACAFAGARLGAPGSGEIMVVDIGGASTELVRGRATPESSVSLQLGAVRQAERHLRDDPPTAVQTAALREEARGMVAEALTTIGGPAPAVGVAGTITTLAAIELGGYAPETVHGHTLSARVVERVTAELCALPLAARREVPGLEPARAPVIPAGALIAAAVMEVAGLDEMRVSERDLLDGVALAATDPSSGVFRS